MQREVPFQQANRLKYPEQVVIALVADGAGRCNPITLGWAMQTSISPPMLAVSVGLARHSHALFLSAEGFVVAMPSEHQQAEALFYGTHSGREMDKLAEFGAATAPARKVQGVLLSEAVANFECRKVGELRTGDHTIFVGQVVCAHVNERVLNRLYTLGPGYKMGGLSRADGPR